jgi:hypothetical protein
LSTIAKYIEEVENLQSQADKAAATFSEQMESLIKNNYIINRNRQAFDSDVNVPKHPHSTSEPDLVHEQVHLLQVNGSNEGAFERFKGIVESHRKEVDLEQTRIKEFKERLAKNEARGQYNKDMIDKALKADQEIAKRIKDILKGSASV